MEEPFIESQEAQQEPKKDSTYPVSWGNFIGFFSTYIGLLIAFSLLIGISYALLSFIFGFSMKDIEDSPVLLLIDALTFTTVILLFKRIRQFIFEKVSFAPLKLKKTYLLMAGGFLICFASQYLIFDVFHLENPEASGNNELFTADMGIAGIIIVFFSACIAAPITEELVFRGLLFRFFHEKYHFIAGLLLSSALFGSLHIGYPFAAGIMGIVFVCLFYYSKSLVPGILLHFLWNSYVTIAELLAR